MLCKCYTEGACLPPSLESNSTQDGGLLRAPMLPARDNKQVLLCVEARGDR